MQMIHTTAEAEKKALAFKNIFNREKETGIYNFHNELVIPVCIVVLCLKSAVFIAL